MKAKVKQAGDDNIQDLVSAKIPDALRKLKT
jgi:hypothetical protein